MIDRRRLLFTAAAGAGLAASGQVLAFARQDTAEATLEGLMERIVQQMVMTSPETVTMLGLDTGPMAALKSRLDDRSAAKIEADKVVFQGFMTEMESIDRAALPARSQIHYDTVKYFGDTVASSYEFPYGQGFPSPYTVNQLGGSYNSVPDFLDAQHRIETAEDAEAYLSRLEAFPTALDQETERMHADFAAGAVPPDFIIERTVGLLGNLTGTPAGESVMTTSIARRAAEANLPGEWGERARRIVEGGIYPAVERQAEALRSQRANATHDAGVWRLPRGEDYYRFGLRYFTTTEMTGAEVHAMGLEQVAELSARADQILRAEGRTEGTVGERISALARDPAQVYPNTDAGREELLASLNAQMADMQARLPAYFGRIPVSPVEVRRVPVTTEAGAPGGYYQPPALDGSRPGAYYINLRDTAEWPKFTLPTLTYHEASPGHHHQIALQMENDDAPMLMKLLGFSAYSEGWGLYAEQLADEMGVYDNDPWGRLGYLQSFMFRAVRLVVDSGLHSERWSREQAIRYMVETLGDAESTVTTEVERYCVWPGQAASYKVGQTVWGNLRTRAMTQLGDRFDIKGFHDTALNAGGVPLTVLERVVDDWIAAQRG
ncbi:DUF885 family protein [Brevundimonas sp. BAL450]|uniref:Tat pathway signal protein n=2 Tax=Brevundimonas TaxID=41275 RepID=A0A8E0KK60_9CAUL|nr:MULTISPECIES: DUF885 family protein [Brevundimonas]MBG7613819.1 DUF885 family protein [Brevundimonas sp. BAL450]GAD58104.1 hypothetical protein MBEBAB_0354 [Brevundimonas abyssalis TAR-001]